MRIHIIRFIAAFLVVYCTQSVYGQLQTSFISPQTTDPTISTNLANHFVAVDRSVPQKNQLFLFFPGTGGTPIFYREIAKNAASLGFHAIGLTYPNDDAVNSLCGGLPADLDCYGNVRLEILDGTDRSPLVDVNRANSVENRIIKLLVYLNATRPNEDWTQFLTNGSEINWSTVIVAGHSQGGGHAGIIGRYHPVRRVLMFAANDFSGVLQSPANWIAHPETTPNATPASRFWGFSHTNDELVSFMLLTDFTWPAYGMPAFGSPVIVENDLPPYANTHSLTSTRPCDNHHGCVAADPRLVFEDGVPVYKPVWDYMLSGTSGSAALSGVTFVRFGIEVGRPAVGTPSKRYKLLVLGSGFETNSRVRINGRETESTFIDSTKLEAKIPAGKIGGVGLNSLRVLAVDGSETNQIDF